MFISEKDQLRKMRIVELKNYDVYSTEINRVALSSKDKRIICKSKINTFAHGYIKKK